MKTVSEALSVDQSSSVRRSTVTRLLLSTTLAAATFYAPSIAAPPSAQADGCASPMVCRSKIKGINPNYLYCARANRGFTSCASSHFTIGSSVQINSCSARGMYCSHIL
jgi:hypothetical protein